jgi:dTDP-4-amino-4,6-dideoxygalactose transaminase
MKAAGECEIEYYEVDLKPSDWTLDEHSVDEEQVKQCDLILCQHIFGVPFQQDIFFELGKRLDIPILEDSVQSGSLYGKYKGHPFSDVLVWSGGIDKTPSCLGGGFGCFRPSPHGARLYKKCQALHDGFKVDSFVDRFTSVISNLLHLMIAKNTFGVCYVIGLYVIYQTRTLNWHDMALKV